MSKCFREEFKYVFTKKKFIENIKRTNFPDYLTFLGEEFNGRQVIVQNSSKGLIGRIRIKSQWCKCIGRCC